MPLACIFFRNLGQFSIISAEVTPRSLRTHGGVHWGKIEHGGVASQFRAGLTITVGLSSVLHTEKIVGLQETCNKSYCDVAHPGPHLLSLLDTAHIFSNIEMKTCIQQVLPVNFKLHRCGGALPFRERCSLSSKEAKLPGKNA
eukprot:3189496-Pleurochrysis_carterae.AAC.4